jgi:acetylornithine/succinyldiaminopimelate/putrescine aminotransferase
MTLAEKDKKYLGRGEGAPVPFVVTKTRGPYLFDDKGRKYIDFVMGWCVGNIGWDVNEVTQRIKGFNGPTYVTPTFFYRQWAELAELLAKITPGDLTKTFRATGGTEAVEIALQAAMAHTQRHKFISIEGSYHGHSMGAMSVGSSSFRGWYNNLLPGCYKIKPPLNEKAARQIEKLLSKKDIAAFIVEPIICNLGVEIPEKKFFSIVQKACKKYGTLLVADEVASGFGRTGRMFASEHYGLKPDIMCLAKGLTGGYGALGATIMTSKVARSFEFNFSFYSTFGWHPLNVEAALRNLHYLQSNKKKLLNNTRALSRYFKERIGKMAFKRSVEVRIKGLAIGLVFNDSRYSDQIIERCMKNRLLVSDAGSGTVIMYPPLNLDMKVAGKGLAIFERSL